MLSQGWWKPMPRNMFLEHALATYLRSPFHFLEYRLGYYADTLPISQRRTETQLFKYPLLASSLAQQRQTAEDNGFNHKLLLHAKRNKQTWLATPYPITVKRFHQATMAAQNDQLGDQSSHARIGEHTVTGARAQIVTSLHDMTDYFQRERL